MALQCLIGHRLYRRGRSNARQLTRVTPPPISRPSRPPVRRMLLLLRALKSAVFHEHDQDPAEVEAAWAREIERRARRVMSGESAGEPWEDVRARVVRRLTER